MYKIDLVKPIFLQSQVTEIAKAAGISEEELTLINCARKAVVCVDKASDLSVVDVMRVDKYAEPLEDITPGCYTGAEGIMLLTAEKGVDIKPLSVIEIPYKVMSECNFKQWDDISYIFANIEKANNDFASYLSSGLPSILFTSYMGRLKDWIECLEHNDFSNIRYTYFQKASFIPDVNGLALRSLNDIGYSLINGWDKDMEEVWEKRMQRFEEAKKDFADNPEESVDASESDNKGE